MMLQIRLNAAAARQLSPAERAVADGVQVLIDRARSAAGRQDPVPSRIINWWRGVLVEAAYRNVHGARAQLVDLYDEPDLDAEIPGAVARVHSVLDQGDPRCITQEQLRRLPLVRRRAWLRRLIEDGYEAIDLKHAQLRSFRNNILKMVVVIVLLVATTLLFLSFRPTAMPLCFPDQAAGAGAAAAQRLNCPTRTNAAGPTGGDVWVVGLIGLLGGALASSIAIRNTRGTSTPYDVPAALAWLKIPLGAFTAILGIIAIHGGFLPGLSALDSQEQILAYALLLGAGQQLLTGVLDRRAQFLLTAIPSKEAQVDRHLPTVDELLDYGNGNAAAPRSRQAATGSAPLAPAAPRVPTARKATAPSTSTAAAPAVAAPRPAATSTSTIAAPAVSPPAVPPPAASSES